MAESGSSDLLYRFIEQYIRRQQLDTINPESSQSGVPLSLLNQSLPTLPDLQRANTVPNNLEESTTIHRPPLAKQLSLPIGDTRPFSVDQRVEDRIESGYSDCATNPVFSTSPRRRGRPPLTPTTAEFTLESSNAIKVGADGVTDFGLEYVDPKHRFRCNVCNQYSAKKRYDVLRHIRYIHTKEKTHNCVYCDKTFAASGALRKHERRHKALCDCTAKDRVFTDLNGRDVHWALCQSCNKPISQAIVDQKLRNHTLWRDFVTPGRMNRFYSDPLEFEEDEPSTSSAQFEVDDPPPAEQGHSVSIKRQVEVVSSNTEALQENMCPKNRKRSADTAQLAPVEEELSRQIYTPELWTQDVEREPVEQTLPSSPIDLAASHALSHLQPVAKRQFLSGKTTSVRDARDILVKVYEVLGQTSVDAEQQRHADAAYSCAMCGSACFSNNELVSHYQVEHEAVMNMINRRIRSNDD